MKLKILLISLLSFFAYSAQAQSYHLGLRMGYSSSVLNSQNDGGPRIADRGGFLIGLVHTYKSDFSDFGFSIETGYLRKGAQVGEIDLDYRMQFLTMPVLLDFYPTQKIRLSVGPSANFLLDARNHTVTTDSSYTVKDQYTNRWELSGVVSASYSLDYFADIGIRYTRGINTLSNRDAILRRRDISTSTLQFFLYLKIAN